MPTIARRPRVSKYDAAVFRLADEYATVHNDDGDLEIYSIPDPKRQVVQIIEVSDSFPDTADRKGVWPIHFRAIGDFPFPTAQVIATRAEWKKIKNGRIKVLADWDLKSLKKVWPRD